MYNMYNIYIIIYAYTLKIFMNIRDASMKQFPWLYYAPRSTPKRPEGDRCFDVRPEMPC